MKDHTKGQSNRIDFWACTALIYMICKINTPAVHLHACPG